MDVVCAIRPPSRLMTRSFMVVLFVFAYSLLTLFMLSRIQHDCPSAEQLASEFKKLVRSSPVPEQSSSLTMKPEQSVVGAVSTTTSRFWQDSQSVEKLLNRDFVAKTVFYIWCGKRWFEFPHYLSVKSVITKLRPDTLIFFYQEYPEEDYWLYNTWFKELLQEYPFLRPHKLASADGSCLDNGDPNSAFITRLIAMNGGTYVQNLTIMTRLPEDFQSYDLINAMDNKGHGYLMAKKTAYFWDGNAIQQKENIRTTR